MNKVILNGHLTKDMEVRNIGQTIVGELTIANNVGYGDNQKTNFIKCSLFGEKRVESLEKFMVKGCKVLISGELVITNVETKEGWKNYINIVIDELEIEKFKSEEEEEQKDKKNYSYRGRK